MKTTWFRKDDNSNVELNGQDEYAEYEEVCESLENNEKQLKTSNSNPPLLVSVTTDAANVLKGKRSVPVFVLG